MSNNVTIQGEMTDEHFNGNGLVASLIASAIPIANSSAAITAAFLYAYKGWLVTGPGIASTAIPILLTCYGIIPTKDHLKQNESHKEYDTSYDLLTQVEHGHLEDKVNLLNTVIYMLPDVLLVMGNIIYSLLMYSMPYRIATFRNFTSES